MSVKTYLNISVKVPLEYLADLVQRRQEPKQSFDTVCYKLINYFSKNPQAEYPPYKFVYSKATDMVGIIRQNQDTLKDININVMLDNASFFFSVLDDIM